MWFIIDPWTEIQPAKTAPKAKKLYKKVKKALTLSAYLAPKFLLAINPIIPKKMRIQIANR
jgi:hypothetical protein